MIFILSLFFRFYRVYATVNLICCLVQKRNGKSAVYPLSKSLKLAKEAFTNGQRDVEAILNLVKDTIQSEKTSQIDYVEMYKLPGLKPVGNKIEGRVLLALAVKFGTTRLIDNVILEDK